MRKTIPIILLLIFVVLGISAGLGIFTKERVLYFLQEKNDKRQEDISVLILGRVAEGQGGQWHRAPKLVDTIILFHYRPGTGVVNLISLPRDLYGEFGGENFKINEIYGRGKIYEFLERLPEITGIVTDNYLVLDAGIIERGVDAMGGIDVEISEPVTDPVSGFRLDPGVHHLDGENAMWLIRNRHAPQGDFFREKNQQAVIGATLDKFYSLTPVEKTKFLFRMVPEIQNAETNFNLGVLVSEFGKLGGLELNSIVLDFETRLLQSSYTSALFTAPTQGIDPQGTSPQRGSGQVGAYILIPTEGVNNYEAIREFIADKIR